jgi:hypothetical protein
MRRQSLILAGVLALLAAACEPRPPKPKTDIERQASPEKRDSAPQPLIAKKPQPPDRQ